MLQKVPQYLRVRLCRNLGFKSAGEDDYKGLKARSHEEFTLLISIHLAGTPTMSSFNHSPAHP
jgi:hypothetical protein